jgi:tRNA pseudouridine55 synthase
MARIDGVLLLDKPVGLTSNRALQRARRLLDADKAGHTGTLDPFASGLLPLCLGEATKFSQFQLDADKAYQARLRLGVTTTTGDPEGEVVETRPVHVSLSDIEAVLARFSGAIEQIPPMHSALKHQGRPLYEYARRGEHIERAARHITIHHLGLVDFTEMEMGITVRCSKGAYIRVLAEDIGAALGCGAHLVALRRTASGGFHLDDAISLERLEALPEALRQNALLPVERLVEHLPLLPLDETQARALAWGQIVEANADPAVYRAHDPHAHFVGLVESSADGLLRARRLMATHADALVS